MTASAFLTDLASADLANLGDIFATAYLRWNSQNSVDEVGEVEAQCVGMKIEPDGRHACVAHASQAAREMTANERLDHMAETGTPPRCEKCGT